MEQIFREPSGDSVGSSGAGIPPGLMCFPSFYFYLMLLKQGVPGVPRGLHLCFLLFLPDVIVSKYNNLPLKTPSPGEANLYKHIAHVTQTVENRFVFFKR